MNGCICEAQKLPEGKTSGSFLLYRKMLSIWTCLFGYLTK